MGKKIILSVISDLVTDQRVHKVATTLMRNGYSILVIGAKRKNSQPISNRAYPTKRIPLFFQQGFGFYAEWNIRLFFKLLFIKGDILLANDLDTLLPNFLVSKFKHQKLVYDSHEYFTEQEEVQDRKFVKKFWTRLESFLLPRLKFCYTVNASIAKIYKEKYGIDFKVVRNMPLQLVENPTAAPQFLPDMPGKKILLTQGVGLHTNRGIEELILSTKLLPDYFILVIAGGGLAMPALKALVEKEQLENKVMFTGILTPTALKQLTVHAFCGFSIDKPTCLNYVYSLPNKLFDFIHAGIPVIGSNLAEVAGIIKQYEIGLVIDQVTPQSIAAAITELDTKQGFYASLKQNTQTAKMELCWEKDVQQLLALFTP